MASSSAAKVSNQTSRIINRGQAVKKEDKLARELKECVGKYVAVKDYKLVACANAPQEVKEIAEKKKIKKAAIFSVPNPKLGHHFF